mgnify:CR=1 FL=1
MTVNDIKEILEAEIICRDDLLEREVNSACGSDMMSDVLAFVKEQAVLLSGLVNPQVIRTAEMMDIVAVCFVRGKTPPEDVIELAKEKDIRKEETDVLGMPCYDSCLEFFFCPKIHRHHRCISKCNRQHSREPY